ncbi:MAG: hypothetical protein DBP00_12060 [gamma proteobacterium symbiont of Ctena orbiculata]|nr:MAG: hypothetical protein DBP00_12060 [gamma proteobacterium symbiont of Ctena orbiculata]
MEQRIEAMKQITIIIAISTTLALAACGKSNDADMSKTTDARDAVSEQNIPSDQAAFEAGSVSNQKDEETGITIDNMGGESTERTNKD